MTSKWPPTTNSRVSNDNELNHVKHAFDGFQIPTLGGTLFQIQIYSTKHITAVVAKISKDHQRSVSKWKKQTTKNPDKFWGEHSTKSLTLPPDRKSKIWSHSGTLVISSNWAMEKPKTLCKPSGCLTCPSIMLTFPCVKMWPLENSCR